MKHLPPEKQLAVFDFDGTLSPGDSIVPFLLFCQKEGLCSLAQWAKAGAGFLAQKLRLIDPAYAKEWTLSFIRGKSLSSMEALADRFLKEKILPNLFPEGLRELERLKKDGYTVLIVSASVDIYMRRLEKLLPVDEVLATPCSVDDQGLLTGQIGPNCRGEEKVSRLRAWEQAHPEYRWVYARGYGDSAHDLPMLSLAEQPFLVSPSASLQKACPAAVPLSWR